LTKSFDKHILKALGFGLWALGFGLWALGFGLGLVILLWVRRHAYSLFTSR
jgi:hypothetical protein